MHPMDGWLSSCIASFQGSLALQDYTLHTLYVVIKTTRRTANAYPERHLEIMDTAGWRENLPGREGLKRPLAQSCPARHIREL